MKKILAIILTLSIFLAAIPLSAVNVFAASTSDLTFSLNSDGASYSVSRCKESASGSLSIPSTYNGKPVTSIRNNAFLGCSSLTSVTIPDSVTSIRDFAFYDCDSLTSVTIGDSVTIIENYAFYACDSLESVNITDIAAWCNIDFENYSANPLIYAKKLYLNDELVTNLVVPDTVTGIGKYAFYNCTSLTSVTIPDSVTSIGDEAFYNCDSLTSIEVSAKNQNYSSLDGILFNKDKTELICYPVGKTKKDYTIPDSVTSIGYSAFSGCDSLTSVTIPDSVTSIGWSAFSNCDSLKTVYYRGSENDRRNITIGSSNSELTGATWYYNSCIGRSEHTYNSDCDAFCNVCAYKREVIHTLGDDGLCTKCGKPPYTVGDLNGDYAVNTTDLAVMKLFLAGISGLDGTGLLAGDLNEDGKVDTTDLAKLKLKLAGIE